MPNQPEWWKELPFTRISDYKFSFDIPAIIAEANRRAWIDSLEWLNKHASGGGDWRRQIEQKLGNLRGEINSNDFYGKSE